MLFNKYNLGMLYSYVKKIFLYNACINYIFHIYLQSMSSFKSNNQVNSNCAGVFPAVDH